MDRLEDFALPRYQTTGKSQPVLPALCLGGAVAGALLGWGYQLLRTYLPYVLLKMLASVVFALVVGGLAWQAVRSGQCRNPTRALGVALAISVPALAASYVAGWRHDREERAAEIPLGSRDAYQADFTFRRWLDLRVEEGWTVGLSGTDQVSGPFFIVLFWGLEALFVLGGALQFTAMAAGDPFCEACQRWTDERRTEVRGRGREEVVGRLRRRDVEAVVTLEGTAEPDARYTVVLVSHACPACERTWLSVQELEREPMAQGKTRKHRRWVARYLALEPGTGRLLRERVKPAGAESGAAPVSG